MSFEMSPPSHLEYQVDLKSHAQEYLGDYVHTPDFMFQELVRTSDVAIRDCVEKVFDKKKADVFSSFGWSSLISAAYLLEKAESSSDLKISKISDKFRNIVKTNLESAMQEAEGKNDPMATINIKNFTRAIIKNSTHPTKPNQYLDFKDIPNSEGVINSLNSLIDTTPPELEFRFRNDQILLFVKSPGTSNLIDQIWETGFIEQLGKPYGHEDIKKPVLAEPHLTIVYAEEIKKIKNHFKDDIDGYNKYMQDAVKKATESLSQVPNCLEFTGLSYSFSFDNAPLRDAIVANVQSESIENAMKAFNEQVKNDLGVEIAPTSSENYHLTVAAEHRPPSPFLKDKKVEEIIDQTGKYSSILHNYWYMYKEAK